MKKSSIIKSAVMLTGLAFISLSFTDYGYPDHTGAPKQATCADAGCHGNGQVNVGGGNININTNIPSGGWVPGETYEINVEVHHDGRSAYGFELMAWGNVDSTSVGTLTAPTGSKAQIVGSWMGPNKYATHKAASITGNGWNSWTFNWTAPDANDNNKVVTFFVAGIAANANGQSTGDFVYSTSITSHSESYTGIAENGKLSLSTFPNPSNGVININLSQIKGEIKSIVISDLAGKEVQHFSSASSGSTLTLKIEETAGIYFVNLNTTEASYTSKVAIH